MQASRAWRDTEQALTLLPLKIVSYIFPPQEFVPITAFGVTFSMWCSFLKFNCYTSFKIKVRDFSYIIP